MLLVASCATTRAIPAGSSSVTISGLGDATSGLWLAHDLEFLAGYRLFSSDPRFGGFSAIETDGQTLWLLSDRAVLWQAPMSLDAQTGRLTVGPWAAGNLVPTAEDRRPLDSEALALDADGSLVAGFEQDASLRRMRQQATGDWSSERLHDGPLIEGAPANQGLESVAALPDGSVLVFAEGIRQAPDTALAVRLGESGIDQHGYRTKPGFSPVGATAAGEHLYVLERSVGLLSGWQSRLTRLPLAQVTANAVLVGDSVLRITAGPLAENYEGVAILNRPDEPSLILLISDDNQSTLQRTLLLVFRLTN